MNLLPLYKKAGDIVMAIFRWDLQLHFFWGFVLTLLGTFWFPLYFSGLIVTLVKEALDLWSKEHWSWGDVILGLTGCVAAVVFLYLSDGGTF